MCALVENLVPCGVYSSIGQLCFGRISSFHASLNHNWAIDENLNGARATGA